MTPDQDVESAPFVGERPLRRERPGVRWSHSFTAAVVGLMLVLAVGAASWSAKATYHRAGVRKVDGIIQADRDNDVAEDRRDDKRAEEEKEKRNEEREEAINEAQGALNGDGEETEGPSMGNVTDVSSGSHVIEGCYDDSAEYKLLTDGYVFDFTVDATFSTVEDGTIIVDNACKAFDFTIQDKFATFTMTALLNVPEATAAEPGMSVTSVVPLEPEVPFRMRVMKNVPWDQSEERPGICLEVRPLLSSAETHVFTNYMTESGFTSDMTKPICSYWNRSEGLYQMMPAGGLTFGPDQGRRLQLTRIRTTSGAAASIPPLAVTTTDGAAAASIPSPIVTETSIPITTDGGAAASTPPPEAPADAETDGGAASSTPPPEAPADAETDGGDSGDSGDGSAGELPANWSYDQTKGEISVQVDIPGLNYDNLTSNAELSTKVKEAMKEATAIEGSWSIVGNTIEIVFMNALEGVTALVSVTPLGFDDFKDVYQQFEVSQLGKVITARLQQIPGIKAACESDPCDLTATASPFMEAANCQDLFEPYPYEKTMPSRFCVGTTCGSICDPATTCGNVICGDGMKTNGSDDTVCKGEDDCMDKCCLVMCDSWECPKETCDTRTGETEATPSMANETCCVMPEAECCMADNKFCQACRECVDIEELCADEPDDPACKGDEAPPCGFKLTSQFNTSTGKAVFSTAVIYGGTRAFSGGFGTSSSGEEYRAWVWDIRTGKTVMSFGTESPVMVVAPSADGLHALTGEQAGTAKVWNYVEGGPAVDELPADEDESPVVGIAGGFTYQNSYVTGGNFVVFWQWGSGGATFNAPALDAEKTVIEEHLGTLKAQAQNLTANLGLSEEENNQLLQKAGPKVLTATQQALQAGIMGMAKVTAVVQLPGNSNFVSGDADGVLRYFNYMKLTLLQEIKGHTGKVTAFSAFPTGTSLLSGGEDGKIMLWDIAKGEVKRVWSQPFGGAVRTLQQIHGNAFLVAGDDGVIRRYSLRGDENLAGAECTQITSGGAIYSIAANPGKPSQVITSSKDGVARVWKL